MGEGVLSAVTEQILDGGRAGFRVPHSQFPIFQLVMLILVQLRFLREPGH